MLTRRELFVCAAAFAGSSSVLDGRSPDQPPVPATFPSHDPALAREMVGVSHGNVARVRELLEAHPALAKAACAARKESTASPTTGAVPKNS